MLDRDGKQGEKKTRNNNNSNNGKKNGEEEEEEKRSQTPKNKKNEEKLVGLYTTIFKSRRLLNFLLAPSEKSRELFNRCSHSHSLCRH